MARVRLTVVDVGLTGGAGEAGRAVARVLGDAVLADTAVLARRRGAVVDVDLTVDAGEAVRAGTLEGVDEIGAGTAVQARPRRAFVYVDLALRAGEAWKNTNTMLLRAKRSNYVKLLHRDVKYNQ